MSDYFFQIASRNIPNSSPSLRPAISLIERDNSDPFQAGKVFQPINSFLFPPTEPFQNVSRRQNPKELHEHVEDASPGKSDEMPYFKKYIERLETGEKKGTTEQIVNKNAFLGFNDYPTNTSLIKNQNAEDLKPVPNYSLDPVLKNGARKSEFTNSRFSYPEPKLIHSENKTLLKPSFKEENLTDNITRENSTSIKRLHPVQPLNIPVNTRNNQSAPKLVIGKITVEVVQAERPTPAKVVNRVIQVPSDSNRASTNKLSFGLGQL
jgi:hypothetical protein